MKNPWTPRFAGSMVTVALALILSGCTTNPSPSSTGQTPDLYLFTSTLDFNETRLGIPHDIFFPAELVVRQHDKVVIHYFNTEDTDEDHTFTMEAPYAVNDIVKPNEQVNVTFSADTLGVFAFRCVYHQPTMTGYLTVIG